MDWLKELLAGNGSLFSLVLAFAVLPSFYLKFAFDMQKEYVDLAKTLFSNTALNRSDKEKLIESSKEALQVFQIEWGLLWAIAILILANFCAIFIVDQSSFANGCIATSSKAVSIFAWEADATAFAMAQPRIECEKVKGLLSLYSVVAVLLMLFQIWWAKVTAMRRLREIYLELCLLVRKERGKPVKIIMPVRRRYVAAANAQTSDAKHD